MTDVIRVILGEIQKNILLITLTSSQRRLGYFKEMRRLLSLLSKLDLTGEETSFMTQEIELMVLRVELNGAQRTVLKHFRSFLKHLKEQQYQI